MPARKPKVGAIPTDVSLWQQSSVLVEATSAPGSILDSLAMGEEERSNAKWQWNLQAIVVHGSLKFFITVKLFVKIFHVL